jgi:hypothetical protein
MVAGTGLSRDGEPAWKLTEIVADVREMVLEELPRAALGFLGRVCDRGKRPCKTKKLRVACRTV